LLLSRGHRVVLPPPYLCCGYPLKVNARKTDFDRIFLENIIILTQIRDMFNDLKFSGCIVSCGTCMESLSDLGAGEVFDAEIRDIAGFLLEDGLSPESEDAYLYHAPCHDSLKEKAVEFLSATGMTVDAVPHCCSEAGTLAISRPDISNAMYDRKTDAITEVNGEVTKGQKILTNCPSCLQGLGRQKGVTPVHLAEELAVLTGGKDWLKTFKEMIRNPEVVTF
ncbi:MAG: (Fe-S)-binding protein, partial [Desulfobacterales bacterium]|nr:(Fe-S)-binding protein [Desulfobacterales bacterium]